MKLQIENFRSLKNTGPIEIKPITVLIGKNSSGKSSFLRTFPLLKQSVEERTKSPILMYGRFVDFGSSYEDLKPHFPNDNGNYTLSFTFDKEFSAYSNKRILRYSLRRKRSISLYELQYSLEFEEDRKNLLRIKSIKVAFGDNEVSIVLNNEKNRIESIAVNELEIVQDYDDVYFSQTGEFVPFVYTRKTRTVKIGDETEKHIYRENISDLILKRTISYISLFVHGKTEDKTKESIFEHINIGSDEEILQQLKAVRYPSTWVSRVARWSTSTKAFKKLRNYIIAYNIFDNVLQRINYNLRETFVKIKYIAPLRATAERYYRIRHLAVNEVDPNGKNLPAFLDSLSDLQIDRFNEWTMENFEFKVKIHKTEGHYSIKIVQADDYEINLSDMGFGYSQILPILTQLWFTSSRYSPNRRVYSRRYGPSPIIIAIEQPELHLHPEFQAKFADVLVKTVNYAKKNKQLLKILIETHSDIIVNRLGDCILEDEIDPDEINLVIFEKYEEDQPSKVSISKFDDTGDLIDWPIGFFQPSYK